MLLLLERLLILYSELWRFSLGVRFRKALLFGENKGIQFILV
jgi:hypothetical protein